MAISLHMKSDAKFWLKSKERLDRRTRYYKKELPYQLAQTFLSEIASAISRQEFPVAYAKLSDKYTKQKGHSDFWRFSGDTENEAAKALKTSIQGAIAGSMPAKVEDTYSYTQYTIDFPQHIQDYINYMEEGTVNMPPRPLFGPIFEELATEFQKQSGGIISDINRAWRGM